MELRQLQTFIAVAEELHVGRAARRVGLTQPAVSMQLAQLEEELGARLFSRDRRRVEMTAAGRFLLAEARSLLAHAEKIVRGARHADEAAPSGVIRLGYTPSVELQLLPLVLRAVRETHPGIEFCLEAMASSRQLVAMQNDALDVGLVRLPIQTGSAPVRVEGIGSEPLILAVPADHPKGDRRQLSFAALRQEPIIIFRREVAPEAYDRVQAAARKEGFALIVAYEVESLQAGLSLVCAGLGMALVPASARSVPRHGVAFIPLRSPTISLELGMITRSDVQGDTVLGIVTNSIREKAKTLYG